MRYQELCHLVCEEGVQGLVSELRILEQLGEIPEIEGTDVKAIRIGGSSKTRSNDRLP